jgi:calcineurin-like phosphoesterase family protein
MNHLNPSELLLKLTPEIIADMKKIHFCADVHHDHPKIVSICNRPTSIEKHNEWILNEVFNKYVGKKDTVYILGDLTFAKKVEADKFLDKLHGNKNLILGNHDDNIHNSTRFNQITQIKDFTYSKFGINIHIILCHYPIASWNRKVHGAWHLYGHVHGRFKMKGLAIDVGIDNRDLFKITNGIRRPINLYEVCLLMAEKYEKENKWWRKILRKISFYLSKY